ncbi:hypothetical protein D3C86_1512480 [compost metagenome]
MRQLLERQFVVEADVIGKEHHVEIVFQRLARFAGGKQAVDRNHRQIAVRTIGFGAGERGETRFVCTAALFAGKQFFDGCQGFVIGRLTFNHNHQVAVFSVLQFRR